MPPPLPLPLRLLSTLALLTGTWAARGALAEPGGALVGGVALVAALWALWPSARLAAFDEAARARRRAARAARARLGIEAEDAGLLELTLNHPSRVMVLSFLLLCAAGGLALTLPALSRGAPPSLVDALFTSVSATCVTGLGVIDMPVVLNGLGQLWLLALIQVGGLGVMAFSAFAFELLGKRLSLSHERAAADLIGAERGAALRDTLHAVLRVTLAAEALGALALAVAFWARGDGPLEGLWRGAFTSISAFCNAGFALQSSSLVPYADSPFILAVTGALIAVGGLGPLVVVAALRWRRPERRTLQARLVLWTSALLTLAPALLIAAVEWHGALAHLSAPHKLTNALFQSVTLRTAGFNSVDLSALHPATLALMICVMFVGGSPGSTAGGVKTTTIAVTLLAVAAVVRGQERVQVFGRALSPAAVVRAGAVCTLSVLGCCAALVAVLLTQTLSFEVALFEVVSALATAGLSVGGTAALDDVGKVIIMVCMFVGRVGPLTLFVFLMSNAHPASPLRRPEEQVLIG